MKNTFFVTGTDTDAGKTVVTAGLLQALALAGFTTLGIKPVAAGCERTQQGLQNDDALRLLDAMTCDASYEQVNPVALEPAIAPHIAAAEIGLDIRAEVLAAHCRATSEQGSAYTLIEGAGGWRVPLNESEYFSDLPRLLDIPVILVVGMKLGCINHALLTQEAVIADGLQLAGWVANSAVDSFARYHENLQTLKNLIKAPLLGVVPHLAAPDKAAVASCLDVTVFTG